MDQQRGLGSPGQGRESAHGDLIQVRVAPPHGFAPGLNQAVNWASVRAARSIREALVTMSISPVWSGRITRSFGVSWKADGSLGLRDRVSVAKARSSVRRKRACSALVGSF